MLGLRQKLTTVSLFAGLDEQELDRLFDLAEVRSLAPRQVLFKEGDTSDALFVVLEGDVEVSREDRVLAELGPGAALGELSLFSQTARRSATIRAICPVTVLRLPVVPMRKLIATHDVAALKVASNLAQQMAERLLALNDRLLAQGRKGLAVARSELRRVVL